MSTFFVWSGALRRRGEIDQLPELAAFASRIEQAALDTINSGAVTGDLKDLVELPEVRVLDTEEFLKAIADRLS